MNASDYSNGLAGARLMTGPNCSSSSDTLRGLHSVGASGGPSRVIQRRRRRRQASY